MKHPTPTEIAEYAKSIGFDLDAEEFFDKYEIVGWVYGKYNTPIKSWKGVVRQWQRWHKGHSNNLSAGKPKLRLFPIGGTCCVETCKMPAVYKVTGQAYDHKYCHEHMPDEVKEQYG